MALSDDLDFFRTDTMSLQDLHTVLTSHGAYEVLQEADRTLTIILRRAKLSFFRVRDPFLFAPTLHRFFGIADARDINAAILTASRGMKPLLQCVIPGRGHLCDAEMGCPPQPPRAPRARRRPRRPVGRRGSWRKGP